MGTSTDRIEKKILLRAPRERVWRAISDSAQFGYWFGVDFHAPFAPGAEMNGKLVGTSVDPEVAKRQKGYGGRPFTITIERVEAMRLFSFRWHPHAVEEGVDYSKEPTTLVEFELEEAAGGTMLTVTETGFDGIPLARRVKAFERNTEGWVIQIKLIEKYLAQAA